MSNNLKIAKQTLDPHSYKGLRKLSKMIRRRCSYLGKRYEHWTPRMKREWESLHNLQREIVSIMYLATPDIIRAAREL